MKLENERVRISEVTFHPGVKRESYIRPTDQVVVFLDDCRFSRTDAETGAKLLRERKSGDVIWHDKDENAPVLENVGTAPFRTLVIELLK